MQVGQGLAVAMKLDPVGLYFQLSEFRREFEIHEMNVSRIRAIRFPDHKVGESRGTWATHLRQGEFRAARKRLPATSLKCPEESPHLFRGLGPAGQDRIRLQVGFGGRGVHRVAHEHFPQQAVQRGALPLAG